MSIQSYTLNFIANGERDLIDYGIASIEGMAKLNELWFLRNPNFPRNIFETHITYDPPPIDWRTVTHSLCQAPILFQQGHGKCDSITAWSVAAYRVSGVDARVGLIPQGDNLFHIVTEIISGPQRSTIDVSNMLPRYTGADACNTLGTNAACAC